MTTLASDVVYGLRGLIKRPGFTAAAILSLALGIAANSTIFSLINGLLLNGLDYPERDRLVILWSATRENPNSRNSVSHRDFIRWQERSRSFDAVGTMYGLPLTVGATRDGGAPEQIDAQRFSPNMFQILGAKPLLGRLFTESEDRIDDPAPVMVLSYRYWQSKFHGAPSAIGDNLLVDNVPTIVIGVMPEGFDYAGEETDAWLPAGYFRAQVNSMARFLLVAARLKPGVTVPQAQAEMDALSRQMETETPERNKGQGVRVQLMGEALFGGARQPLLLLQGVTAFVLLIACANVAGLLLARASSRSTEVAVRSALGAGRGRIIRQMLTESLLLAMLGGVAGVMLAWVGLRVFVSSVPVDFPRLANVDINANVLLFTAGISLVTGFLFGLAPAIQASRSSLASALRESSRSVMTGGGRSKLRGAMVAGQIALALVLLIGAGLLINSFLRMQRTNLGVDPNGVMTFEFRFPQNQLMKLVSSYRGVGLWEIFPVSGNTFSRIHERLAAIPGVQSVAGSSHRPLNGVMNMAFLIEGRPAPPSANGERGQQQVAGYYAVTPKFFETMKVPIIRGRDITAQDTAASLPVIVINQAMAKRYWPNEDPIGRRITLDFVPDEKAREIIGIAGDTRTFRRQKVMGPLMYVPHVQQPARWQGPAWNERAGMTFLLRTSTDPTRLVNAIRGAVAEIDPTKPVNEVETVEQYLDEQVAYDRLFTVLLSIFGFIAIVLAAVGIYGVMAYMVAQRTQEIGIRMALGASRRAVTQMVLRHAGLLTGLGLLVGLAGSFGLTRLIADQLYDVTPTDPVTFIGVSLMLIAVSVVACLVPARRAVAVDPNIALRHE